MGEPEPFAITPAWVLDARISDKAVRLYGVLALYADHRTGKCIPSRRTLADRLQVADPKAVDRAATELEKIGALRRVARHDDLGRSLPNGYQLHRRPWGGGADATPGGQIRLPTPDQDKHPERAGRSGEANLPPQGGKSASLPATSADTPEPQVARGRQIRHTGGAPAPHKPEELQIPTGSAAADSDRSASGSEEHAGTILAAWISSQPNRPPTRVIGQASREVKGLVGDGYAADAILAGLAAMTEKGLSPSNLASLVNGIANGNGRRPLHATRQERPQWD